MVTRRLLSVSMLAIVLLVASGCDYLVRANVRNDGSESQGAGFEPAISADGRYVAFTSLASDLAPNDFNGGSDVFVRDLRSGTTRLVSTSPAGMPGNDASFLPAISGDGRYVAFTSLASDLVASDGNADVDVFVRDLQAGVTTRISVASNGGDANSGSDFGAISADGRFVGFVSAATNLVTGDGNSARDVFVRNLQAGTTARISVDATGQDANGPSVPRLALSADGRYVAFPSEASDLVAGDGNGASDVFVRDRQTATTKLASVLSNGLQASIARQPSISADGRYVTFWDGSIHRRDLQAGTTSLVVTAGFDPSISGDGRLVAFASDASNLVPGDTNHTTDVFVRDAQTGTTNRVSVNFLGGQANGASGAPAISGDGRYVAFASGATNLVGGDRNGATDVHVRGIPTPTVESVTPSQVARGTTATLTVDGMNFLAGAQASTIFGPGGVSVNSVTVVSETVLEISVTVDADAQTGSRDLRVWNPGTGPGDTATSFGICSGCLTVT